MDNIEYKKYTKEEIIDRLTKLQTGQENPRQVKVFDNERI